MADSPAAPPKAQPSKTPLFDRLSDPKKAAVAEKADENWWEAVGKNQETDRRNQYKFTTAEKERIAGDKAATYEAVQEYGRKKYKDLSAEGKKALTFMAKLIWLDELIDQKPYAKAYPELYTSNIKLSMAGDADAVREAVEAFKAKGPGDISKTPVFDQLQPDQKLAVATQALEAWSKAHPGRTSGNVNGKEHFLHNQEEAIAKKPDEVEQAYAKIMQKYDAEGQDNAPPLPTPAVAAGAGNPRERK